jgi:hypothetical protein
MFGIINNQQIKKKKKWERVCEHYNNKENRFLYTEGKVPQDVILLNTIVCLKHL